jgi:ferrous iron transport protein B
VFAAVVIAVFQTMFAIGDPAKTASIGSCKVSGNWLTSVLPAGWIQSRLVDGIWTGVGSVIVFLPQVLVLFLFIGILEDSGYLARAALIADRTMARAGLQGQVVHPAAFGLCLRGACDYVHADHREQAGPYGDDSDRRPS